MQRSHLAEVEIHGTRHTDIVFWTALPHSNQALPVTVVPDYHWLKEEEAAKSAADAASSVSEFSTGPLRNCTDMSGE
jgi:hypothetical protein